VSQRGGKKDNTQFGMLLGIKGKAEKEVRVMGDSAGPSGVLAKKSSCVWEREKSRTPYKENLITSRLKWFGGFGGGGVGLVWGVMRKEKALS